MRSNIAVAASAVLLLTTAAASPLAEPVEADFRISTRDLLHRHRARLAKRAEPTTGDDLEPPDGSEPPQNIDKVETAFSDAMELASYALSPHADDILLHYFDEGDRALVNDVFTRTVGGDASNPVGNDLLGDIMVQTTDTNGACTGGTLAASYFENEPQPFIVLCPNAFNKKAVTSLNGVEADDPNALDYYLACDTDGGDLGTTVSYRMNSLGMTLLHEYMHYDAMLEAATGGPIIDQDNGYGPVNVYENLDHALSPFNADSYAYYASHNLWATLCQEDYGAPVPGTDDNDPDCGGVACAA